MVWLPSADSSLGYRQLNSVAVLDGCAPSLASLVVLGMPGVCTKYQAQQLSCRFRLCSTKRALLLQPCSCVGPARAVDS